MSLRVKHILLGFTVTIVPLVVIDFVLHSFFLTDGYINNSVVGNILSFQLTYFQGSLLGMLAALIFATLFMKDYLAHRKITYQFKGNERAAGLCVGVILAAFVLEIPWLQPDDYQRLLGWVMIFTTLLVLRRNLKR